MANIKYTRLVNEFSTNNNYLRWAKNKLPIDFLKQQIFLLIIIFCSLLLLIITAFFTSDADYDQILDNTSHKISFGVIVDCGSSGTRAHIFKWVRDEGKQSISRVEQLRDSQKKPLNKHITPGLSTLRDRPDNASEYMEPIMNFISESIPRDYHIGTPIYFMATAGMRLLDDLTQKKILSDITRDLRAKYNFPKIKSQVITGQYEGAYSWLSVNMNRFYNATEIHSKSLGIIEMGGASVQVTFELDDQTEKIILDKINDGRASMVFQKEVIILNSPRNTSIKLFATSFLGLGVNSAREFAIDFLTRDYLNGTGQLGRPEIDLKNLTLNISDPCLTIGSSEIVIRPAEVITNLHKSLGFVMKDQTEAFKVKLEGSGNFLNCLTLLERVIRAIKFEEPYCIPSEQSCPLALLGTNFIAFDQHPFVGLSEMYYTTKEIMNSAGPFNRSRVLRETNRICSSDYKSLELDSQKFVSQEDRALYECFKATWLLTIVHNSGLKMPTDYDAFSTIDRIDDREIDWTAGAMLWETLKL
jgi:Golgi nucleoside diphosphatase